MRRRSAAPATRQRRFGGLQGRWGSPGDSGDQLVAPRAQSPHQRRRRLPSGTATGSLPPARSTKAMYDGTVRVDAGRRGRGRRHDGAVVAIERHERGARRQSGAYFREADGGCVARSFGTWRCDPRARARRLLCLGGPRPRAPRARARRRTAPARPGSPAAAAPSAGGPTALLCPALGIGGRAAAQAHLVERERAPEDQLVEHRVAIGRR